MPRVVEQGRVIRAAQSVFARFGFKKTSMDDVARESEVSKATIYTHFGNKQSLWQKVVRAAVDEWQNAIFGKGRGDQSIGEFLRTLFVRDYQFIRRMPLVQKLVVGIVLKPSNRDVATRFPTELRELIRERIEKLLEAGVKSGEIDVPDTKTAAIFLQIVNRGLVASTMLGNNELDDPETIEAVMDLTVRALTGKPLCEGEEPVS